jgi:hypothetical protein
MYTLLFRRTYHLQMWVKKRATSAGVKWNIREQPVHFKLMQTTGDRESCRDIFKVSTFDVLLDSSLK